MEAAPVGDPYAEYLAWKASGRPPLSQADFTSAIPLPASDDAPEDPVGLLPGASALPAPARLPAARHS